MDTMVITRLDSGVTGLVYDRNIPSDRAGRFAAAFPEGSTLLGRVINVRRCPRQPRQRFGCLRADVLSFLGRVTYNPLSRRSCPSGSRWT